MSFYNPFKFSGQLNQPYNSVCIMNGSDSGGGLPGGIVFQYNAGYGDIYPFASIPTNISDLDSAISFIAYDSTKSGASFMLPDLGSGMNSSTNYILCSTTPINYVSGNPALVLSQKGTFVSVGGGGLTYDFTNVGDMVKCISPTEFSGDPIINSDGFSLTVNATSNIVLNAGLGNLTASINGSINLVSNTSTASFQDNANSVLYLDGTGNVTLACHAGVVTINDTLGHQLQVGSGVGLYYSAGNDFFQQYNGNGGFNDLTGVGFDYSVSTDEASLYNVAGDNIYVLNGTGAYIQGVSGPITLNTPAGSGNDLNLNADGHTNIESSGGGNLNIGDTGAFNTININASTGMNSTVINGNINLSTPAGSILHNQLNQYTVAIGSTNGTSDQIFK